MEEAAAASVELNAEESVELEAAAESVELEDDESVEDELSAELVEVVEAEFVDEELDESVVEKPDDYLDRARLGLAHLGVAVGPSDRVKRNRAELEHGTRRTTRGEG